MTDPAAEHREVLRRRVFVVLFAITLSVFTLAWAATPLPRDVRVAVIDIGWFLSAFLAGAAFLYAARDPANHHLRRSFVLLGIGSLGWAVGQCVWTYQEVAQNVDAPVFAVADIAYWAMLPFAAAAVFFWPREPIRWRLDTMLDFILITGFAALFGIEFVLDPLLDAELDGLASFYAFAYPPGEIVVFGAALAALLLPSWHDRRRLELIAFGVIAFVVADAGYTYLGDDYSTGSFLDPLWAFGFGLMGAGALAPAVWRGQSGMIGARGRLFAPAATLVALVLLGVAFRWSGGSEITDVEFFALLGLMGVLAFRQGYAQLRLAETADEQRRLEQELLQAQKLDAVGRLAGGVAHDFNNLLTAIDGYTELALHGLATDHPVREDLAEVRRATQRASELTRQLLVFSRRQVLAPGIVDLNVVVAGAERLLRRHAGPDVELDLRLDSKPAFVVADAGQLEQVVTNLVVNARDAMPEGGTVTVVTRVTGDRVALSVTDTGVGMTDDVKAKIFEPFFTTKEPGSGTGLGLAVVHGIVTQSRGELSVMTAPGRGSTFFAAFPAAEEPAPTPEAPAAAPRTGDGTLLLVEDEPTVRDTARRILELAGFDVVPAAGAEEALEVFDAGGRIDALVTDVVMPGMRGDELAAELLRRRPGLPVVLMSGYSVDSELIDALRAEGAVFLDKPYTADVLVAEVRSALDSVAAF